MNYEQRVAALEAEGLTTSDAQGVVDAEDMKRGQNTLGRIMAEQVREAAASKALEAAAPELLEVLSSILNPNNGAIGHLAPWLEAKARAALSKTRGNV